MTGIRTLQSPGEPETVRLRACNGTDAFAVHPLMSRVPDNSLTPTPLPRGCAGASGASAAGERGFPPAEEIAGPFNAGPARSFSGDLTRLIHAVEQHRPFAFARFGDGEWMIVCNLALDYTQKGNGEFRFDPAATHDQQARQALIDSFHHSRPGYLVGIGCPCCWGREKLLALRAVCRQPEDRLTWANLWGNANYPRVRRELTPLFRSYHRVFLVHHRRGDPSRLPFRVTQSFPVGANAWTEDYSLASRIAELAAGEQNGPSLFLFCAGPLSNILAHVGHATNPNHIYLDFGSVLDPWLFARRRLRWLDWFPGLVRAPGVTRGYLKPGRKRRQVCEWWTPTATELTKFASDLPANVREAGWRPATT